jgi:endonuclease/exonuclease/phosphatase family metal-dependent hydrolase
MSLRIATYNIHRCIGTDGAENPDRIAAVLREINADVFALQEVAHQPGSPGNVLDLLADAVDAVPIEGTTLRNPGGNYGNALLTRLPAADIHRTDISVPRRERRGALDVRLTVNGRSVRVVATHLGLRATERRYQIGRIYSLLRTASASADVTILLGDMNVWFGRKGPLLRLASIFETVPAPATFPSHRPLLALDRLWVRPRSKLTSIGVHRSPLARRASDHLPLVADITL